MPKAVSRDELLEELRRLRDELEQPVSVSDMDERGRYSSTTYYEHFESWEAACEAAGVEPVGNYPPEDAELLEDLRRLADELGRAPTASEITSLGEYGYTTYYRRFGGISEACLEAGVETHQLDPWRRKAQELRQAVRDSETAEIDVDDTTTVPSRADN